MAKFVVEQYQLYAQKYEVEAKSEAEAIVQLALGARGNAKPVGEPDFALRGFLMIHTE